MISTDITSRNFEADDKIKAYIDDKIGGLERFVPKNQRNSMKAQVVLQDDPGGREDNRFVCDAIVTIQGQKFVANEGTVNIYAAVDIVEAKLKSQLVEYKAKHAPRRGKIMSRIFRREAELVDDAPEPMEGVER
jgi:putative sigma-54 modulation protein